MNKQLIMFVFCIRKCAFIYWVVFFLSFTLLFVVLETRQLLVPVAPEYWIFKMASSCYFLVLFHGSALFAVWICNSGSISSFLIFPLPADHSWQRNRGKNHQEDFKQTRRDRPISKKKVGTYDKCEYSNFFLFQRAKMIISVLVKWMIVDWNLAVRVLLSF